MAAYNVFVPGYFGTTFDLSKITGGQRLTVERPVSGTMFYGVNASSATSAVAALQAAVGVNKQAPIDAFLASNDTQV